MWDAELKTLCTSRFWRCDPWNYNSMVGLKFKRVGKSEMVYAYGQKVYATILFRFRIASDNTLQLTFEKSPPHYGFNGYIPGLGEPPRDIHFSLESANFSGVEANVGPSTYHWKLTLNSSPFPGELKLPPLLRLYRRHKFSEGPPVIEHQLPEPLVYFGHVTRPPGHALSRKPVNFWRGIRDLVKLLRPKPVLRSRAAQKRSPPV